MIEKTSFVFILSKLFRQISLIFIGLTSLNFLLLSACVEKKDTNQVRQTAPLSAYTLTPGETLERLYGGHDHDLGHLEIYVGKSITWEEYTDKDGATNERESITFRILYPVSGSYEVLAISVHEGQEIELGEYRLRIVEIRMHEGGDPIVEMAIFEP